MDILNNNNSRVVLKVLHLPHITLNTQGMYPLPPQGSWLTCSDRAKCHGQLLGSISCWHAGHRQMAAACKHQF